MRKNKKWTFQFVNFTICYEEINSTVHWTSLGRDALFAAKEPDTGKLIDEQPSVGYLETCDSQRRVRSRVPVDCWWPSG